MINIDINEVKYKLYEPDRWDELTIDKAIELNKVVLEAPDSLRATWDEVTKPDDEQDLESIEITTEDLNRNYPKFYGDVLRVLSNIPNDVIKKILPHDRNALYKQYLEWFVLRIYFSDSLRYPYHSKSFTHNNIEYHFPQEEEVLGTLIPAYKTTAVEFQEASDVLVNMAELEAGNLEAIKMIIAIYCRPKGEVYDEHTTIKRSKEFGNLTMDIAYGVFFCTIQYITTYMNTTLISQAQEVLNQNLQQKPLESITSDGRGRLFTWLKNLVKK